MNKLFFILLFIGSTTIGWGQYDLSQNQDTTSEEPKLNRAELLSRTYVGGELSLSFGSNTQIYLSPFVGYDIFKPWSAGVSMMYQYNRIFDGFNVYQWSSYGAGTFTRYRPIPQLVTQLELNWYNNIDFANGNSFEDRTNLAAFMGGLGYAGDWGGRAYYNILLMYDFINNPNMPLPQLITGIPLYLRYGFVFYLGDRN